MVTKRNLVEYIETLRQTIKELDSKIESLESQYEKANDFQFLEQLCGQKLLFCDENAKVKTDSLLGALKFDGE